MSSMYGRQGMGGPAGTASGLKGTGYQQASIQQFTPEQMDLFKSLFGQVGEGSFLSKLAGGDQGTFEQLEAPALKQFSELQSGIANRFSGAGLGARRSSGFANAQTSAAQDFASQLQSQRLGLQRQAIQDLMSNSQMLLGQRPQDQFLVQEQVPFWKQLLGSFASGAGGATAKGLMAL